MQIPEIFRGVDIQEHPPLRVKGAENLGGNLEELLARIELLDLQAVPIGNQGVASGPAPAGGFETLAVRISPSAASGKGCTFRTLTGEKRGRNPVRAVRKKHEWYEIDDNDFRRNGS